MALNGLHYWANENKVTDEPLQVRYTAKYGGSLGGRKLEGKAYEYHRYATKVYRYVGMDERTARACAEAKLAQYTRARFFWFWDTDMTLNFSREIKTGATVKARHTEGHLWSVEINVNEDDVYYSPLWIDDIAAAGVFDSGDYDEDAAAGAVLVAKACYWLSSTPHNQLWISYSADIDGFNRANLAMQYTVNGRDWIDFFPQISASEFDDGVWCIGFDSVDLASNAYAYRIKYGDVVSNYAIVPGASSVYSGAITLAAPEYTNGFWRIAYQQDVQGFSATTAALEQSSDGSTWTVAPSYYVTAAQINTGDSAETSTAVRYWRLKFGSSTSNAVSVASTAVETNEEESA